MNARSLKMAKENDMFCIVAEDRISHKRVKIHYHFDKGQAIEYRPTVYEKRCFKYFRVVKEHEIYI